ncbi:MAG: FG-GAP repeat protein, partial [Sulfurovaceae bacterium]|nr:FG-GAP repeat protein [Sulfurovaceae bacterium]
MKILQRVGFLLFFILSVMYATPEIKNSYNYEETSNLSAPNTNQTDYFGTSTSISGDYMIVGVFGDNENGSYSGSAYIFKKDNDNNFTQITKLTAFDTNKSDHFGYSVSISGDYAIIGAYANDDNASNSGSAYIFKKDNDDNFTQIAKLTASDPDENDYFGRSVSISGDYVIIGAYGNDDNGSGSGSVYIFKKDNNDNFTEIAKLIASDPDENDNFGASVSISGDYAIIGAYGNDDNGSGSGSAYIFKKDNNDNFTQITKLIASDANESNYFGDTVNINGDYAIVGAYGNDNKGAAYVFKNNNDNFTQIAKLTALDRNSNDLFGSSLNISEKYAIVGAMGSS